MVKLLLIVVLLVALAFILLGVNILLFKRKFPETEVGKNRHMAKLGLSCPQCEERRRYRKPVGKIKLNSATLKPDWIHVKNK